MLQEFLGKIGDFIGEYFGLIAAVGILIILSLALIFKKR